MTGYSDYIKGGEILIAPSLEYDHNYILKCSECEEYHSLLESFLSHSISHYGLEPNTEQLSPTGHLGEMYDDDNGDVVISYAFSIAADSEGGEETHPDEYNKSAEDMDPLNSLKHEADIVENEIIVKEEYFIQEANNLNCADMETTSATQLEQYSENMESDNESSDGGQDKQTRIYIDNFMKSEKNITTLISAYKNIPHMWNLNYPAQLRKKTERTKYLQQIAAELDNVINLQITSEQVSAIIAYLRLKYRERLKCGSAMNVEPATSRKKDKLPLWIFQNLAFLKPFAERNPIAQLDSYPQDLAPEQIIQILDIYKRCPYLWDTNLMEHYCNNKRSDGLQQMIKLIESEMGIDVDENALKTYLRSVNVNFAREKRNEMGSSSKTKEGRSAYFVHMSFLDDHVGPFICIECKKKFKSPIYLKAHMSQHKGATPLHCPLCKHEFKTAEAYVAHVRRHMGDLTEECIECGKRFLKSAELRIHMRSHTGNNPFSCDLCGSSYRQQQGLLEHKRKHEQKFVHYCPICSKGFYTKSKMNVHKAIHYDVRNFVCGICGKAFKTKRILQSHEATHEEGRNHKCDLCGKLFKNRINLGHHMRTHGSNLKGLNTK